VDSVTQYSREVFSDTTLYATVIAGYDRSEGEFPNILNTPGVGTGLSFTAAETPTSWNSLPGYSGGDTRVFHRFDDFINSDLSQNYYGSLVLGMKGYFGDSDWQWDVTSNNQVNINEVAESNLATVTGARDALISGRYNPFDLSQRDTSGLGIDAFNRNRAIVHWLEAKTNGALGSALGFDWSAAFGTSAAHFAYADHRNDDIVNGNVMMQAGVVGNGGRELYSVFSEFVGQLGSDLELQFSMRGDFYSDFGETFNPKLAFKYNTTNWLSFRGSVGTGFQAPTLQNMNARIEGFDFLVDQVRCQDPSLGAGNPNSPDCRTQSISIFQDSNPDLKEETSISANIGTIIQPTKNFTATIDYWYAKVEDTIGAINEDLLLLEQRGTDVSKYGVNIIREGGAPNGRLQRIELQLFNVGTEEASGTDIELAYRLKTSLGDFTFLNETSYMFFYNEEFYEEFGNEQVLGQFGLPRWRNNFTLGWGKGNYTAQAVARSFADVERNVRGLGKIVSPTQVDVQLGYNADFGGRFQLGVINLGNVRPRFDDSLGARVNGSLFQRIETYYLTYRQDF
jgi:iron complex outermembrane receptor protein